MLVFASAATATVASSLPVWFDYAALVVGSMAGTVTAATRKLDLVGHVGLALLCGLGGGLIRDVIMQVGTANVYMLSAPYAIVVSAAVGVAGFFFPGVVNAHPHALEWLDIISVGFFCATGAGKAVHYDLGPSAVILMGTVTGVGGGMLRDITLGDVPHIFRSSNLYATCAIAGSALYLASARLINLPDHLCVIACVAIVVILRRISLHFDVQTAPDANIERHVRDLGSRMRAEVESHAIRPKDAKATQGEMTNGDRDDKR